MCVCVGCMCDCRLGRANVTEYTVTFYGYVLHTTLRACVCVCVRVCACACTIKSSCANENEYTVTFFTLQYVCVCVCVCACACTIKSSCADDNENTAAVREHDLVDFADEIAHILKTCNIFVAILHNSLYV